jgi:hypothetical protein
LWADFSRRIEALADRLPHRGVLIVGEIDSRYSAV